MHVSPLGDSAAYAELGTRVDGNVFRRITAASHALDSHPIPGMIEYVPGLTGIAVHYDPAACSFEEIRAGLDALLSDDAAGPGPPPRSVDIPVCYDEEAGPDLDAVARHAGVSADEVVRLHAGGRYVVHMLGFVPGFPYLGGLPARLVMPRRATPRTSVPAGSVGIAGDLTGVYPFETPGGWQLVGRTPLRLFDPSADPPALLRPGDEVRFRVISRAAFEEALARGQPSMRGPDVPEPVGHNRIAVLTPGVLTTVQDHGRPGYQRYGVGVGGAMDRFSLAVANALVGNPANAAALEITLVGPALRFAGDTLITICGADLSPTVDGHPVPAWRPVLVRAGGTLRFGQCVSGCRACLAVAGGLTVPPVLGSRSTNLRAGFGGVAGRALRAGDTLVAGRPSPAAERVALALASASGAVPATAWSLVASSLPVYHAHADLRVVPDPQITHLPPASRATLFGQTWRISSRSDRMGYRLQGSPVDAVRPAEPASEPVVAGTVQLPPDGLPILLLADRQTTGGYLRAVHVSTADLAAAAQLKAGDTVRFREVTLETARMLHLARLRELARVLAGIRHELDRA
jgi:KipI family sensor histidine kinase inhibitor